MIKARFFNNKGCCFGFEISGHAGYAEKGHDIVCASVSSAVQMACNTITEIIGAGAYVGRENDKISLRLLRGNEKSKADDAEVVFKGLRLHLSILKSQFDGTIRIEDSEV